MSTMRLDDIASLALPVMAAPMFIASGPELVIAQCKAGIVGAFPALNARPEAALEAWIIRIKGELASARNAKPTAAVGPFAVNIVVHHSNARLAHDLDVCVRQEVPILITSLASSAALPLKDIVARVHAYGGQVFHDVTTARHARKALSAGVDGLILVCAGAGGHAGTTSPFALVREVRTFYEGPLVLAGAITTGDAVLAARVLGCDMAYIGTLFIATDEAQAPDAFKQMVIDAESAADVAYTSLISGAPANFLKASLRAAGLDPENLPAPAGGHAALSDHSRRPKAWRDVWSAGHGIGTIDAVASTRDVVARLQQEYEGAKARMARLLS